MWSLEMLLGLTLLQATVHSVLGLDMYQDAVDKYAKWIKKYGSQRSQRNTNIDLSSLIFVPHRYYNTTYRMGGREGGRVSLRRHFRAKSVKSAMSEKSSK